MNGPQDVGGRHGCGPVIPEDESIRFHADWEKRVLGMTLAAGALGYWNIDASRHARESLPPAVYYGSSYYEIWLRGLEVLLLQSGEVTHEELAEGQSRHPGKRTDRCLAPDAVGAMLAKGGSSSRSGAPAAFAIGQSVRTRNIQPEGHTRLPAYARGHVGTIELVHGPHVFPDSNARFDGEAPQPLYTVAFQATDLFGDDADATLTVSIDAWEPYLDPA